jgi:TRAP-type C4-dicarboxylate transport system permease small subunit
LGTIFSDGEKWGFMKGFLDGVLKINIVMQAIAGISLTFMIALTTMDVILRIFGKPIPGAVEIIAICGGVVIGFTLPITSWMRGHIAVDFVLNWLPTQAKSLLNIVTRCVGMGLCLIISWNSMKIGLGFWKGAEVSGTLELPLYPIAYALAASFLVLSIVLFCDILKILRGSYE